VSFVSRWIETDVSVDVVLLEPVRVVEQVREGGPDRVARLLGRAGACDRRLDVGDEGAHHRRVEDVLVTHVPGSLTFG